MSEREQDALEPQQIDPPDNQLLNVEATEIKPVDPPDGNGGTGGGLQTPKQPQ
jgi:hypothetical protein